MTTGTIYVFIPHILVISISRSLYLESFSATLTDIFRSDGTAISMSIHVFSLIDNVKVLGCSMYGYGVNCFNLVDSIQFIFKDHSYSSIVFFPDVFLHF